MSTSRNTILCIDDEKVIRLSFSSYLEDYGYTVHLAENGEEGIKKFREIKPDVVLVDLRMPVVDGFEVLSTISKETDEIPVIVISGTGSLDDVIEAIHCGAWDYIFKPVEDMAMLLHSINKTLERAELISENRRYKENLEELVKQRTIELKESEEKFRLLAENAQDIVFRIQKFPDFKMQFISQSVERITGYSASEFYNDPNLIFNITHPDHSDHFRSLFLTPEIDNTSGKFQWVMKNRMHIWIDLRCVPVYDENNNIVAIEGIARDITRQKKIENILELERAKLKRMLKNEVLRSEVASKLNESTDFYNILKDVMNRIGEHFNFNWAGFTGIDKVLDESYNIMVNISGNKNEANNADKNSTGTKNPGRLLLDKLENIFKRMNRVDYLAVSDHDGLKEDETDFLSNYNIKSFYVFSIKITEKMEGKVYLCDSSKFNWFIGTMEFCKTITDLIANAWERIHHSRARLLAEQKHTKAVQTAEQAMRLASIGTLAAGITHEINQPLNALKVTVDGMIYWSKRKHDTPREEIMRNLEFISNQSERISDIINEMRVLTRKEKNAKPLNININDVVETTLSLVSRQLSVHSIEVKLGLDRKIPQIMCNKTQMEQIVVNLLTNAIQALDKYDRENKKINISTKEKQGCIFLDVKDNGPGIQEENLKKIFDPFFTTKSVDKGMGFGLSIIQNIISSFNGTITAENNKNGGACFSVTFPENLKEKQENL